MRRNPICRVCRHLMTAHAAGGCRKRRSTPGGRVYPCQCALSLDDLAKDPANRIDPPPKEPK